MFSSKFYYLYRLKSIPARFLLLSEVLKMILRTFLSSNPVRFFRVGTSTPFLERLMILKILSVAVTWVVFFRAAAFLLPPCLLLAKSLATVYILSGAETPSS